MESDMARVQNGRREQTSRRNSTAGERKKRERYYRQYDYMLLFMTVAIALFGILMIYSASSYTASTSRFGDPFRFVSQQLRGLILGVAAMLIISNLDYRELYLGKINWIYIFYGLCIAMQVAVLIPGIGIEHNGARRWLKIGVEFQPSEFTKIGVILFVAYAIYQSRRSMDTFTGF